MSAPEPPPLDAGHLFDVLERHAVDFVVVGGLAGLAHGSLYPTYDLDFAYARDPANLTRLTVALRELEVKLTNAPPDLPFQLDARTLENGANFTFDTPHGRFDILGHLPGIRSFDELRQGSTWSEIEGHTVRVASLDHLIAMKRKADRAKDRLMVEEYIVLAEEASRDR